ncbi:UNVERIFIED_CONTAM: hypothetical protein FKN15_017838 [Acipenser sinensis]
MSKAEIYRSKGDITMSIVNYTRAIKARPEDDEAYFRRAQMFEKSNEKSLAIDDYAKASTINPKRTDALMIHGLHFFKNLNWSVAIQDFTAVMKHEPLNAKARTYRGRAYAKQGHYQQAVEDLSAAVHLDPNNWIAFYHRGCLLRKSHCEIALRDLSVSVLINDSVDNLNAFLHRGILYTELNQWMQDITSKQYVAVAHMNLGLIFMLKMENHYEAIRRFTSAIKIDPTCNRAYVCRAEAYNKVHDLQRALKDVTQAIHLQPDTQHLYIMRGEYLCKMKKFELASFCIHYAAEMNKALGSSPIQQAAVQSFLGNNTKAIDCLVSAIKTCPTLPVIILLGKTQMKAKKYKVYLSRAAFYGEKCRYSKAVLNCNEAIKIHPKSVRAYLYRGALKFYMKALKDYGIVLLLGSRQEVDLKVLINRGLLYAKLSDHHNALLDFKAATMINPEDPAIFNALGICHHRLGQLAIAIDAFNQAIKLKPFFLDAYVGRGNVYMDYGHEAANKQAQRDFLTALHLNPACSKARINLGYNFQVFGNFKKAWNQFTIVADIDPTCSTAYEGRSVINLQMGNTFAAFQDVNTALKLNKASDELITNRGVIHQFMGDHSNAMKDYQRAITINPHYALAYFNAANIYFYNRQFEQHKYLHGQALLLQPRDALVYKLRADVRGQLGLTEQAILDYKQAVELQEATQIL